MAFEQDQPPSYVLTLACPDRPGLVYAVSSWLMDLGGNILESQQFGDRDTGRFFMRVQFEADGPRRRWPSCGRRFDAVGDVVRAWPGS